MKRYILFLAVAIICLVTLDQGVKLIVEQIVPQDEALMRISDTVHIHPYINGENLAELTQQAKEDGKPFGLYLAWHIFDILSRPVLLSFGAGVIAMYLPYVLRGKRRTWLWLTNIALVCSATVCNVICLLLRGGSLDYFCIATHTEIPYGDHFHSVPRHFIFDLKDVFLWIGIALFVLLMLLLVADFIRCENTRGKMTPEEHKQVRLAMKQRAKSFFKGASHGN